MKSVEIEKEKRQRISNIKWILMVAVAVVIDGLQFLLNFIPILGWFFVSLISVFAWLTFFVWFKFNGISFLEGKRAILKFASLFGVSIIEIFPLLNDLPAWTAYTVLMFFIIRGEDMLYNSSIELIGARKRL